MTTTSLQSIAVAYLLTGVLYYGYTFVSRSGWRRYQTSSGYPLPLRVSLVIGTFIGEVASLVVIACCWPMYALIFR